MYAQQNGLDFMVLPKRRHTSLQKHRRLGLMGTLSQLNRLCRAYSALDRHAWAIPYLKS